MLADHEVTNLKYKDELLFIWIHLQHMGLNLDSKTVLQMPHSSLGYGKHVLPPINFPFFSGFQVSTFVLPQALQQNSENQEK